MANGEASNELFYAHIMSETDIINFLALLASVLVLADFATGIFSVYKSWKDNRQLPQASKLEEA